MSLTFLILIIVLLILISGFFSASETALTSLSQARVHALAKKNKRRGHMIQTLHQNLERLIGTILLGNNLVNILATSLMTTFFLKLFEGESAVSFATLIMTCLILIFGEVMPKMYAINFAERLTLLVAPFIYFCFKIFGPITLFIQKLVRHLWQLLGINMSTASPFSSVREEIRNLIDLYGEEDLPQEKNMLKSIFDLSHITVDEVMTPRHKIISFSTTDTTEKIMPIIQNSGYSRFPVWEESEENIIGLLHIKQLFPACTKDELKNMTWQNFIKTPAWFVPNSTPLHIQLQAFRTRQAHMAFVVDEYGTLVGLVTLEDILEEIVGEIVDEHDETITGMWQENDHYLVAGNIPVRDINRRWPLQLPEDKATTIAGLLMHEIENLPQKNHIYRLYGYDFEVLHLKNHQVRLLRIHPSKPHVHAKQKTH